VLKIAGVRQLIKRYGPLEDFDRTAAITIIGNCDPVSGAPQFTDYEKLFIEPRDLKSSKLKPHHAFSYLLGKDVFRVGLSLTCPICELEFWLQLDDIANEVKCELCGNAFKISRQLKDRSWMYRRSGLFGKENNQEGSIPVALTLQQLENNLRSWTSGSLFLTSMRLTASGADISPCETDIFVAIPTNDKLQVAIGECKDTGGEILEDDVKKLTAVADSFPPGQFETYLVFSKTAAFTSKEIERCRTANHSRESNRVILLSDRELEPYFIYEKASEQYEIRRSARSLDRMAQATSDLYFAPKHKRKI
jgi:hypothetical protein